MPVASAPLLIKVCGITRVEDGLAALELGADWLGFIRWARSPRHLPLEDCAALVHHLRECAPRPFEAVGVFVDAGREAIELEAGAIGLDRIQLHGQETAELARQLSRPALKALRLRDEASLAQAEDFPGMDLLIDAWVEGNPGGTGQAYDYRLLVGLAARRRVIVAGGLNAGSVGWVVAALAPWGVDVSSGVEDSPGIKNHDKMREFIKAARLAARSEEA